MTAVVHLLDVGQSWPRPLAARMQTGLFLDFLLLKIASSLRGLCIMFAMNRCVLCIMFAMNRHGKWLNLFVWYLRPLAVDTTDGLFLDYLFIKITNPILLCYFFMYKSPYRFKVGGVAVTRLGW